MVQQYIPGMQMVYGDTSTGEDDHQDCPVTGVFLHPIQVSLSYPVLRLTLSLLSGKDMMLIEHPRQAFIRVSDGRGYIARRGIIPVAFDDRNHPQILHHPVKKVHGIPRRRFTPKYSVFLVRDSGYLVSHPVFKFLQ
jgi:hypothetical protein